MQEQPLPIVCWQSWYRATPCQGSPVKKNLKCLPLKPWRMQSPASDRSDRTLLLASCQGLSVDPIKHTAEAVQAVWKMVGLCMSETAIQCWALIVRCGCSHEGTEAAMSIVSCWQSGCTCLCKTQLKCIACTRINTCTLFNICVHGLHTYSKLCGFTGMPNKSQACNDAAAGIT